MWIFESALLDILFLFLPVLATLALFFFGDFDLDRFAIMGIVVFTWIDSGHVYTTALRTYFNREEFNANKQVYVYAPLLIFFVMWSWLMLGGYFIWDFIMYATIYHNIRQYYGVTRWYQKNIGSKEKWQTRFLYILTIIPVILFHFREGLPKYMYIRTHLPNIESPTYLYWGKWFYVAVITIWLLYQLQLLIKNKKEFIVTASVFVPVLGYALGFIYGRSIFEVAAPIIVGHGIGYMGLMTLSLKRTHPEKYKNFLKVFAVILAIAVLVGSVSDVIEENFLGQYDFVSGWGLALSSLGLAMIFTPLLLHYYVDALIWSGKHRESHLVFSKPTK